MLRIRFDRMASWTVLGLCSVVVGSVSPAHALDASKALVGPCDVKLEGNLATVKLPAGYIFIDKEEAKKILEDEGEKNPSTSGIVIPITKDKKVGDFQVYCSFNDCGYIKDDDAEKLNPDELLKSFKEICKQQNEERESLKLPPFYVGGWAEKPHYEPVKHQVIWAVEVKDADSPTAPVSVVNYNTRILGRRGTLSLNLVTAPDRLSANKPKVAALLDDTTFNRGETYADYVPGKDKAAEYGIAGLILGGGALAAAKLGVFGAMWKWGLGILLLLKKFIIVLIAAIAAFVRKLFGGKPKNTNTPPS